MTISLILHIERKVSYRLRLLWGIVELNNEGGEKEVIIFKRLRIKLKPSLRKGTNHLNLLIPLQALSIKKVKISPRGYIHNPFATGILYPFFPKLSFYGESFSIDVHFDLKFSLLRFIKMYYNKKIRRR